MPGVRSPSVTLARRQLTLDLNTPDEPGTSRTKPVKARQVVLHVHLADGAIARVENPWGSANTPISVEQVAAWCTNGDTQVVIKPVIDLTDQVQVDNYEVPDRMREREILRQGSCVFPWCTRSARTADMDHIDLYDPSGIGGPTSDDNLAPLCRRHHRAKTHTRWRYDKIDPTTFVWRSPAGLSYRSDHTGTTPL
jgi:hypothetical protein